MHSIFPYGRIGENDHLHDVDVGGVLRAVVEVELPQLVDGDLELPHLVLDRPRWARMAGGSSAVLMRENRQHRHPVVSMSTGQPEW